MRVDRDKDFRRLKQLIVSGMYRSYEKLLAAQKRAKSAVGNK
jgi:hypothetical protein